jgi:hypothetical protein
MHVDRRLAFEAAVLLVVVRSALRVCSFGTVDRLLARWSLPRATRAATLPANESMRVGLAVRVVARRLRGTNCLAATLAAETMLRRRGIVSIRHIGVRPPSTGSPLDAHAWLEADGAIVIGEEVDLRQYHVLTKVS